MKKEAVSSSGNGRISFRFLACAEAGKDGKKLSAGSERPSLFLSVMDCLYQTVRSEGLLVIISRLPSLAAGDMESGRSISKQRR